MYRIADKDRWRRGTLPNLGIEIIAPNCEATCLPARPSGGKQRNLPLLGQQWLSSGS